MDWVHCNSCFRQPGDKQFFLTNCGHIVCEVCREKWISNKCSICNDACTITSLSGNTIQPEIKVYFCEADELVDKISKEFPEVPLNKTLVYLNAKCNQLKMVLKFQKDHRRRYFQFVKQMVNKQRSVFQKIQSELQEYKDKYDTLSKENAYCKKMLSSPNVVRDPSAVRYPSSKSPVRTPKNFSPVKRKPLYDENHPAPFNHNQQFATPAENISLVRRNSNAGSGSSVNSATSGPSRLSMRTPPINGRIAPIPGNTHSNMNMSDSSKFPQLFTPIGGYGAAILKENNKIQEKLAQLGCHSKR